MTALSLDDPWAPAPKGQPNPPGGIHVWRADPYRTGRAPRSGFYAVGAGPVIRLREGEPFPEILT